VALSIPHTLILNSNLEKKVAEAKKNADKKSISVSENTNKLLINLGFGKNNGSPKKYQERASKKRAHEQITSENGSVKGKRLEKKLRQASKNEELIKIKGV